MLFDVTFDPFKVVLQHSINCTDDYLAIKFHTKRVLLEILDTYGSESLNLTWSGGIDSAFIGLCFNELVEEGKLPPSTFSFHTGRFTVDGNPSLEWERGLSFYKRYINSDIKLRIHDISLNDISYIKKICSLIDQIKIPFLNCLIQEQFRIDIGGRSIVGIFYPRRHNWEDYLQAFLTAKTDQLWHYLPNSPSINVFDWDADIWSSLMTPLFLNRPTVLYDKSLHFDKYLWDGLKSTAIQYILCFPQLFELIFKHITVPYNKHYRTIQIKLEKIYSHNNYKTSVTLPDSLEIKSLNHIQEYFGV